MNVITLTGLIGKDAQLRCMPNGDPVASFSVADSPGRDKPTLWWACQIFGKRAQALRQASPAPKPQHPSGLVGPAADRFDDTDTRIPF